MVIFHVLRCQVPSVCESSTVKDIRHYLRFSLIGERGRVTVSGSEISIDVSVIAS